MGDTEERSVPTTAPPQRRLLRVGFALKKDKARKHIRSELIECAKNRGIEIVVIDEFSPLEDQGPFDAILQKIRRPEFERHLEQYAAMHPDVKVCDPPKSTILLRNRHDMLNVIPKSGFTIQAPESRGGLGEPPRVHCSVPTHLVLGEDATYDDAIDSIERHGLTYPIIAKSLWADGRPGSHDIAVIWSSLGIRSLVEHDANSNTLKTPVILEQYVNHGECLFKVYVLGSQKVMVTRPSLHLDDESSAPQDHGMQSVNRISAYPSSRSWGKEDLAPRGHGVPCPPQWVWQGIAEHLQRALKLTLFNFDIIVPLAPDAEMNGLLEANNNSGLIHLIDINYYPGVEKLPSSELVICNFLENLLNTDSSHGKTCDQ